MSRSELPSLRAIFDEYAPFVWRALRHLGVRDADIEDQCQEVFLVVHRRLETFEQRSSLRTWIYGICVRTASDYRRRAYVRRETAVADPPEEVVPASQVEQLAAGERQRVLLRAIAALDDDKRVVFVLFEIEGLPMKEVAAILACPLQTAYSRLHAARALVHGALGSHA